MKTKTLVLHLAVVCLLPLALACAKKETKKDVQATPAIPKLDGDYSTGCINAGQSSFSQRVRFGQLNDAEGKPVDHVLKTINDFTGNTCANLTSITEITYKYKLSALRSTNLYDIDYVETDYQLTPATMDIAANWNRTRVCERTDWEVNVPRSIDKGSNNCIANDRINKRPLFSVIKVEGNNISLGMPADRSQDGLVPERRETGLSTLVFGKSTAVNPTPIGPEPIVACPNLDGLYSCTQGDAIFAGKDVTVATATGNDRKTTVQMALSRAGSRPEMQVFQPSDGERSISNGGFRIVTKDVCEATKLINTVTASREGDTSNRSLTVKEFTIGDRGSLNIITRETDVQDNRPGRERRTDTQCIRR